VCVAISDAVSKLLSAYLCTTREESNPQILFVHAALTNIFGIRPAARGFEWNDFYRAFCSTQKRAVVSMGRFISVAREKKKKITVCGRITFFVERLSLVIFFFYAEQRKNIACYFIFKMIPYIDSV